jgi:hypothetical protein
MRSLRTSIEETNQQRSSLPALITLIVLAKTDFEDANMNVRKQYYCAHQNHIYGTQISLYISKLQNLNNVGDMC